MIERIFRSDVVIVFSNGIVDDKTLPNYCGIRTALDRIWRLKIPVQQTGAPADETLINNEFKWRERFFKELRSAYSGLRFTNRAEELARKSFQDQQDDWLVNTLFNSMTATFDMMGWTNKEIIRGSTLQRRRYNDDSEFVLNLCLEAGVDRLYGGKRMLRDLNAKLFHQNQVQFVFQNWYGSDRINAIDSVLDVIARYDIPEINEMLL